MPLRVIVFADARLLRGFQLLRSRRDWLPWAAFGGAAVILFGSSRLLKSSDPDSQVEPEPPVVQRSILSFELLGTGSGSSGLVEGNVDLSEISWKPAYWAKVRVAGIAKNDVLPAFTAHDPSGKAWRLQVFRQNDVAYLALPPGYGEPPKSLQVIAARTGMPPEATFDLKEIPPSPPPPPPKLTPAWKETKVEYVRGVHGGGLFVDAPIAAGNLLTAKVIGSSAGASGSDFHTNFLVRDPSDPQPRRRSVRVSSFYPDRVKEYYLRIVEQQLKEETVTLRFPPLPVNRRFGKAYPVGRTTAINSPPGTKFWIEASYPVPVRQPRGKVKIQLRLNGEGLLDTVSAEVLSPGTIEGEVLPLFNTVEKSTTRTSMLGPLTLLNLAQQGTWSDSFLLRLRLRRYVPKRTAVVAAPVRPDAPVLKNLDYAVYLK